MASKLPFKFFDWKRKLTTWSIRINKTFKHKVLAKSRNALIITQDNMSYQEELIEKQNFNFDNKLRNLLKKTWQIHEVNLKNVDLNKKYQEIETQFGGRQYDAIIVMPKSNRNLSGFSNIEETAFATSLQTFNKSLLKNILAYRLAHKYLATSGVLIFSNSEADFGKVENKDGELKVKQPALKNILDAQVSYLTVTVGDRDYTDLNSWSVTALSEEHLGTKYEDFVVQMYADWANGANLPMPGSFAIFKTEQEGKKAPFVQYL